MRTPPFNYRVVLVEPSLRENIGGARAMNNFDIPNLRPRQPLQLPKPRRPANRSQSILQNAVAPFNLVIGDTVSPRNRFAAPPIPLLNPPTKIPSHKKPKKNLIPPEWSANLY